MGALLGDVAVGYELCEVARKPHRDALLANASLGPNHVSLGFHLEQMTPEQCIDLLVKRVGHELDNATAEVRRSFNGTYGPLYQCAYLLGGLQFRALHKELVESGKMTNRAFHDFILKENRIPVEMVRALLIKQKLARDFLSELEILWAESFGAMI